MSRPGLAMQDHHLCDKAARGSFPAPTHSFYKLRVHTWQQTEDSSLIPTTCLGLETNDNGTFNFTKLFWRWVKDLALFESQNEEPDTEAQNLKDHAENSFFCPPASSSLKPCSVVTADVLCMWSNCVYSSKVDKQVALVLRRKNIQAVGASPHLAASLFGLRSLWCVSWGWEWLFHN